MIDLYQDIYLEIMKTIPDYSIDMIFYSLPCEITDIAYKSLNRNFLSVKLDKKYFEITKD